MLLDSNHQIKSEFNFSQKLIKRFLEIFFRYLYHEMAWAYDWVAAIVSLGKWKSWTETSLDHLYGQKILELGHGPGHLLAKIVQTGHQAYGIDISTQMTGIAANRLKQLSLPINLSTAQTENIPFGAEAFDQIVATFPTEYILEESTLKEIYRVLKPGGSVVIIPVAYITGTNPADKIAAWLFRITGQAPVFDDHAFEPAIRIGFDVSSKRITLKNSDVIIILAKKQFQIS
jgi:ubiquinone/menaquinone biosynthesis C-methylase UbiE